MAQINVSVPEGLKTRVETLVASGRYSSASDYIRDLIRRDEERVAELADLQAMIDAGISSGIDPREPVDIIEEIIAQQRSDA